VRSLQWQDLYLIFQTDALLPTIIIDDFNTVLFSCCQIDQVTPTGVKKIKIKKKPSQKQQVQVTQDKHCFFQGISL